eukprot:g66696.t1
MGSNFWDRLSASQVLATMMDACATADAPNGTYCPNCDCTGRMLAMPQNVLGGCSGLAIDQYLFEVVGRWMLRTGGMFITMLAACSGRLSWRMALRSLRLFTSSSPCTFQVLSPGTGWYACVEAAGANKLLFCGRSCSAAYVVWASNITLFTDYRTKKGGSLTILPGVVVTGNGFRIIPGENARLQAIGSATLPIRFNNEYVHFTGGEVRLGAMYSDLNMTDCVFRNMEGGSNFVFQREEQSAWIERNLFESSQNGISIQWMNNPHQYTRSVEYPPYFHSTQRPPNLMGANFWDGLSASQVLATMTDACTRAEASNGTCCPNCDCSSRMLAMPQNALGGCSVDDSLGAWRCQACYCPTVSVQCSYSIHRTAVSGGRSCVEAAGANQALSCTPNCIKFCSGRQNSFVDYVCTSGHPASFTIAVWDAYF